MTIVIVFSGSSLMRCVLLLVAHVRYWSARATESFLFAYLHIRNELNLGLADALLSLDAPALVIALPPATHLRGHSWASILLQHASRCWCRMSIVGPAAIILKQTGHRFQRVGLIRSTNDGSSNHGIFKSTPYLVLWSLMGGVPPRHGGVLVVP